MRSLWVVSWQYRGSIAYTLLFDVNKVMVYKMPLTKLVSMNLDLYPYLVALLIAVLYKVGDKIRVLERKYHLAQGEGF